MRDMKHERLALTVDVRNSPEENELLKRDHDPHTIHGPLLALGHGGVSGFRGKKSHEQRPNSTERLVTMSKGWRFTLREQLRGFGI